METPSALTVQHRFSPCSFTFARKSTGNSVSIPADSFALFSARVKKVSESRTTSEKTSLFPLSESKFTAL